MNPILSVAIPTHNRARYAIHAIHSLLEISDARLEIVVSDTSNDGELEALINADPAHKDPRLNYFQPPGRLDMTGNHNAAIMACRGDYVCLIGDDDTISAEALDATEWAQSEGIELIAPNVVANYVWPDFRSRFFGYGHAARLYFARKLGKSIFVDCTKALAAALDGAAQGTNGLPKIYHGIVSRALLERIRSCSGAYFHGSSPDVSGAIGLAMCSNRFVAVDYPLTIPGASGGSNTGRSAMNTHKGSLNQEAQTKAFTSAGWSGGVPKFFSVETVWAHAALETIGKINPEMQRQFNFARLLGICRVLHPEYSLEISHAEREVRDLYGIDLDSLTTEIDFERRRFRRARLLHIAKRILRPTPAGGRAYVSGLATIAAAPAALAQQLQRRGLSWLDVIKDFKAS